MKLWLPLVIAIVPGVAFSASFEQPLDAQERCSTLLTEMNTSMATPTALFIRLSQVLASQNQLTKEMLQDLAQANNPKNPLAASSANGMPPEKQHVYRAAFDRLLRSEKLNWSEIRASIRSLIETDEQSANRREKAKVDTKSLFVPIRLPRIPIEELNSIWRVRQDIEGASEYTGLFYTEPFFAGKYWLVDLKSGKRRAVEGIDRDYMPRKAFLTSDGRLVAVYASPAEKQYRLLNLRTGISSTLTRLGTNFNADFAFTEKSPGEFVLVFSNGIDFVRINTKENTLDTVPVTVPRDYALFSVKGRIIGVGVPPHGSEEKIIITDLTSGTGVTLHEFDFEKDDTRTFNTKVSLHETRNGDLFVYIDANYRYLCNVSKGSMRVVRPKQDSQSAKVYFRQFSPFINGDREEAVIGFRQRLGTRSVDSLLIATLDDTLAIRTLDLLPAGPLTDREMFSRIGPVISGARDGKIIAVMESHRGGTVIDLTTGHVQKVITTHPDRFLWGHYLDEKQQPVAVWGPNGDITAPGRDLEPFRLYGEEH